MRDSGSNLQYASYVADGVQQNLINWIEDKMTLAGWTVSSGSHSATIVLRSATTPAPASHAISVRLKTTGNACSTVQLLNAAGTVGSLVFYLLPTAGLEYRIIAGKYQVFLFVVNSAGSRTQVHFGVPYVPDFMVTSGYSLSGDHGWISGNGQADNDGTVYSAWRVTLGPHQYYRYSLIRNGTSWNIDVGNSSLRYNPLAVAVLAFSRNGVWWLPPWASGPLAFSEPLIGCQEVNNADYVTSRLIGSLWDAMVENAVALTLDTTVPFDSKTWYVYTGTTPTSPSAQLVLRVA